MAQLIVEIHLPLVDTGVRSPANPDYAFGWIFEVEEYLAKNEDGGGFEVYDDGEELGNDYLFFLTGANERTLLSVARDVARLPGMPKGAYAIVTDDEAEEMGVGQRAPLS
ncbi:hypothetical protein [Streptomyces sp. SID13031]|uniref:hypothetical protein n=1 Tax=Streptomyces sp. SID13031 TaxID=2706046 RepID=UPI0013C9DB23|nr:hypothetical protein [Streptomyces sp. SID13031]NEA33927.1 hypothetical protein [Streptomyces sp. SID13031]